MINNGSGILSWLRVPAFKAGKLALAQGIKSVAVTFATARADALFTPVGILVNTTDPNPIGIPIRCIAISTAGFTFEWDDLTPTGNYFVYWSILEHYDP